MKRLLLIVFLLLILLGAHYAFSQDIAIISSIPTDKEIDQIALAPNTGIAYGINKEEKRLYIFDLKNYTIKKSVRLDRDIRSIAVDSSNNLAYVTAEGHGKNGLLYVIDSSGVILKEINIPRDPEGIAVNPNNKTIVISIEKGKKVSVFSTETFVLLKEIHLPHRPELISIDIESNRAVVVADKAGWFDTHDRLLIVDLNTNVILKDIRLKIDVDSIAVDINKDIAVAVSSNRIMLLDINTGNILSMVHTDDTRAVDINQSTHNAVVTEKDGFMLLDLNTNTMADYDLNHKHNHHNHDLKLKSVAIDVFRNTALFGGKHSVIEIQLPNPVPEITAVTPSAIQRGSSATSLTITGNKFTTSSAVYLNSQYIASTFLDNNNLRITIPSEMMLQTGFFSIGVLNPQPGGGNSNIFSIPVNNPIPSIIFIEPTELKAGTIPQTLTIIGTGFFPETEIHINKKDETDITKKQGTLITNTKLELAFTQEELKTAGQYEIRVYNPAPGGGYSNTATLTIKPSLEITITSPQNNETINKTKTIVKGTCKTGTKDIGITVNGVIAEILGNEWTANVPLTAGTNTITATIKDNETNKAETTITINVIEQTQYIQLTANIVSGIAPLTTYFTISTQTANPITSYKIDFEGDGIVDYTGTTFDNINHAYTQEGIFYPTITITDDKGNTFTDTIAIAVVNKTEIDTLLKTKWEGMKNAFANKEVEKAVSHFHSSSQEKYRSLFTALMDMLPQIASDMQNIELISIENGVAEYRIKRLEEEGQITYYIYFALDENGIWKIQQF